MNYIVFDTETTGLNRRRAKLNEPGTLFENGDEVIQIGGVILDNSLNPKKLFCHYCDVLQAESHEGAREVHGILLDDIRATLPNVYLEDVLLRWVPEFFSDDVVFIGYNSGFDIQMVAQTLRNFCFDFEGIQKVTTRMPQSGRWQLDTMAYLPKRVKLTSLYSQLTDARNAFYAAYANRIPLETNNPEMLEPTWRGAHNSLFDAIETYLLFKDRIWQKKLFGRV